MDELKQSVQLAVHEQNSLIYKFEAFNLSTAMLNGVNKEVIFSFLFKDLPQQSAPEFKKLEKKFAKRKFTKMRFK
jgi:preprotein translocase subunit SecA